MADIYRFYGYAFDLNDPSRYLYTEVHEQEIVDEVWRRGRIRYYDPAGRLLADKPLDFAAHPYVPNYTLRLDYKDYEEGIRVADGQARLFKRSDGRRSETTVALRDDLAADSGFHAFLRDHFDRLMAGETVNFRLAVAGNQDSFRFRARKTGETTFDGRPAVRLVVQLNSLLRLLVSDLEVLYEPQTRQLVEYRGISNIHDPATGNPYNVRIVYTQAPPEGAPSQLPPLD